MKVIDQEVPGVCEHWRQAFGFLYQSPQAVEPIVVIAQIPGNLYCFIKTPLAAAAIAALRSSAGACYGSLDHVRSFLALE
jgi:hypothetical protein